MERRMWVYAAVTIVLVGALVWIEHYPSSPMITTLGLPGPRANDKRECGNMYRQVLGHVRLATRELVCRNGYELGYLRNEQDVTIDALSRRIVHARRLWSVTDSVAWEQVRDSIPLALVRLGGERFSCSANPADSLIHIRGRDYWKFPSYSVRFIAYREPDNQRESSWLLQLDAYPKLPPECGLDPWRHSRNLRNGRRQ